MALRSFAQSSLKRVLSLREPLRLGQVNYSARTLWLLRPIVTDGSVEQIDKKLAAVFEDLLLPGMGDQRQLVRIVGADKTIKIESLKGTRDLLPAGAWAGDIKLGLMRTPLARKILEHPDQWPTEIVGRAIQQIAGQMNHMPPIAQLAEDNKWFQIA